jgi:choline dehydrogenase-like flavoprotein
VSEAFDYVIVGGGTAGCILANRLSADPKRSVCLIEAGSPGRSWLISMPMGVMWLMKHRRWNWNFTTEPQEVLNRREIVVPPGRALGGSSAIDGMVYTGGLPSDFDGRAARGCSGWAFDDVLPTSASRSGTGGSGQRVTGRRGRAESRGTVRLKSVNAPEAPAIDPAMLTAEAEMETMVRGVKLANPVGAATDDDMRGWLRERTATVYHPVGSCRMGAVVDPQLRFRGSDASVMPRIVSGSTNAPARVVAEKAADMIRAT